MNLQSLIAARIIADKPVRVGLIGAGKFGSMFLTQVPSIAGLEVVAISDLGIVLIALPAQAAADPQAALGLRAPTP